MSADNKNCLNFVKIIAGLPGRVVYITCIPMTCCGEIWGWFRVVRGTQGHGQCHHLIERIRRSTTNVCRSLCCRCRLAVSVVAALWSTFISTNGHKCYKILIFIGSTYDAATTETIHRWTIPANSIQTYPCSPTTCWSQSQCHYFTGRMLFLTPNKQ